LFVPKKSLFLQQGKLLISPCGGLKKKEKSLDKFGTCGSKKTNAVISVLDMWRTGATQVLT